jgi:hypothetical protein
MSFCGRFVFLRPPRTRRFTPKALLFTVLIDWAEASDMYVFERPALWNSTGMFTLRSPPPKGFCAWARPGSSFPDPNLPDDG